jgi:hypothetical protein
MIAASVGPNGKMPPEMSLSTSSGHQESRYVELVGLRGGAESQWDRYGEQRVHDGYGEDDRVPP